MIEEIDASGLAILERAGPTGFELVLSEDISPTGQENRVGPLISYDLDDDGLPEIILVANNLVFKRSKDGHYEPGKLCLHPADFIHTAVMEDFDGDGRRDLLVARFDGLTLFRGTTNSFFDQPGELVWRAAEPLKSGMVLSCGDINGDGSLDVFLGQYRPQGFAPIIRPYYYDANDCFPSYLLNNDGHGQLNDVTTGSGIERRRKRRVFSAVFADLDDDGKLDLSVVSDFAGIDLYQGDGQGRFREVTSEWIEDSKAFGMGQVLADFNRDGRQDLFVTSMNSPTADRLNHLGLWHPAEPQDRTMRGRMTLGNRLLVRQEGSRYVETPLSASIHRSGWAWGCAALDFNNDGFPDVYIATGNETRQRVRDYEGEFWLQENYIDPELDNEVATAYFSKKYTSTIGAGWSYGGHERNHFFLNQRGQAFLETGFLMGVSLGQDSRSVLSEDLDRDGKTDLLVATEEVWPKNGASSKYFETACRPGDTGSVSKSAPPQTNPPREPPSLCKQPTL